MSGFQSTLSVRRATGKALKIFRMFDFNPRSPWGERRKLTKTTAKIGGISIHALREESDEKFWYNSSSLAYFNPRSPWGERLYDIDIFIITWAFQSTLSVRRATEKGIRLLAGKLISIHALREESDWAMASLSDCLTYISIHALREESDQWNNRCCVYKYRFQSTLSVRRATMWFPVVSQDNINFNPRSPWGERPLYMCRL